MTTLKLKNIETGKISYLIVKDGYPAEVGEKIRVRGKRGWATEHEILSMKPTKIKKQAV